MKKWVLLNNSKLEKEDEIIKAILLNRGLKTKKEIEEFLNPTLDDLTYENVKLKKRELDKAVKRIKIAIENKEPVIVYTDYDVDGVCSGAIVWEALFNQGAKVLPYVPHRLKEGYGLSEKGIDTIHKQHKVKLIITVDHGVTAREKIEYARKLGIDVIIIDHHILPPELPKAIALIHTTSLCATGIAWFFVNYLLDQSIDEIRPRKNLDLVVLATIADLIPLTGINRILVKFGLEELKMTRRIGLLALIKTSGLKLEEIGVYEVGHMLAPRINAAGRLTHALDSLRLLCTKDPKRAKLLAEQLSLTNRERQLILEETTIHAKGKLKVKNPASPAGRQKSKLIFIAEEGYNQGVIGLVAGKLVEEYYRPAIVISKGEKYSKASARSIAGFNIVAAIRSCSDLLVDVGGHPMAAGFTVETAKLSLLEDKLLKLAEEELTEDKLQREIKIDCELELKKADLQLFRQIEKLAPFGVGNPQPVFISKKVKVVKIGLLGKDKNHLKLTLQPDIKYNEYIDAIGFGMGKLYNELSFEKLIDIVYTLDENKWNNHTSLQLKLKDVKISAVD